MIRVNYCPDIAEGIPIHGFEYILSSLQLYANQDSWC
jgi:hypothetical protein